MAITQERKNELISELKFMKTILDLQMSRSLSLLKRSIT